MAFHKITAFFFPPLTLIASFFFIKDSSFLTMKAIKQLAREACAVFKKKKRKKEKLRNIIQFIV